MTDYLEELLNQQEQEERSDVPEWRRLGVRVYATGRYRAEEPEERMGEHHGSNVDEISQGNGHRTAAVLAQQLDRLHRAVRQAQEQSVRTAVSVQGAVPSEVAGGMHAGPLSVRRAADYAAAMDAAFQRDARRYDGPLGLL